MKKTATFRRLLAGLTAGLALCCMTERAEAQEILLTGPLAGAPAARKLRLYRKGRLELAPHATFSLLDEYQRHIVFGARLQYNITDWLGIGVWGGYAALKLNTGLTDEIQQVNQTRRDSPGFARSRERQLTSVNLGENFEDQVGQLTFMAVPQISLVPFRGKLALFQSLFVDTELYFHAGAAIVGVDERASCDLGACPTTFSRESRVAVAPSFGLGFTFFVNKWNAVGLEYRAIPFAWNTGGFDVAGADPDGEFPDNRVNDSDRQFRFNQFLTVSWNFYLPTKLRISE